MFEMLTSSSNLNLSSSGFFSQFTLILMIISNVVVQSKPQFLKILIFVELVFCNNFKCELKNFTKWIQVNSDLEDIDFASTP